eukprot:6187092-Pleurochrysis_carterae.AAC.1
MIACSTIFGSVSKAAREFRGKKVEFSVEDVRVIAGDVNVYIGDGSLVFHVPAVGEGINEL